MHAHCRGIRVQSIEAAGGNLTGDAIGDPHRVAAAIISSAAINPAPRRLTLGSDAYRDVRAALTGRIEELEGAKEIATSTGTLRRSDSRCATRYGTTQGRHRGPSARDREQDALLKETVRSVEHRLMSRSRPRRPLPLINVAVVVAAVIVGVLLVAVLQQRPSPVSANADAQPPILGDTRPVLAVIGDSYSGGSAMGGTGEAGWPALLAVAKGWSLTNLSQGGTGFVAAGTGAPFAARLQALVAAHPGIVIVEGGHNDEQASVPGTEAAAYKFLTSVKKQLPSARLIVIGPIWPTDQPPASELELDAYLKSTAAQVGAQFIDPIADSWFGGTFGALIGVDGTHPTDAGHQHIADLMKADLK
jgi:lysophospholipase L1-like esterase